MRKQVRVKDLPESTLDNGIHLFCPTCGDKWAASRGDYFMASPDHVFRCEHDDTLMQLTRTVTREVAVR